ncbi:sperm-associated antigen 17 isoform X1 [Hippoglossus hippoglossus]|uniref:sperm-associated antigen 17 isoform X1 n=1 Tax=Hippoglossus hippoglossus TaxID=8267 RepID=UPI00148C6342|nr:sperm-associated antigen 17 isoform X1 [Hippoglossus hippoglossus]
MPPKAGKKGSAKKPNAAGEEPVNSNWEAGLTGAQFEEDSWRACVSFVVGGSLEDDELIQALAVQPPQRKLFTSLTLDSTIAMIQELGNPKTKRDDDTPMFYEVAESAKVLLDAGEEIPCDLMAKILKFQLLQVKTTDQQRRAAEQALEEMAKAGSTPVNKGPDKKGKAPPPQEKKTKLKRRDDVEPPKFIEDEPEDGPQHYILVLGFHQPHLIWILDAIGVHVANVIKVCSEEKEHTSEGNEQSPSTSPVLDADSDSMEQAARARRVDLFWAALRPVLDSAPFDSKLHNVAQLSYTVPDLFPSTQPRNTDSLLELGSQVFDSVAYLLYDCLDWRRQHQHYLDNSKLINVPTVVGLDFQRKEVARTLPPTTPNSKKKTVQDADMRYYSDLLNLVPTEACSVPLIMHCMLEQVVMSSEQSDLTQSRMAKKPKPNDASWLDCELVDYMLQSCLPLVHTEEERSRMLDGLVTVIQSEGDKKRLVEKFGAEETKKKSDDPLVIRHHDERALRLRDINTVKGFDPAAVELSMIKSTPVWELIHSVADPRKSSSCWMAIKQQLQHYCTDDVVSWPQVERLFHQSVFETMPLTRLDQNSVLQKAAGTQGTLEPAQQQETPTIIPWDNPQSYAKQLPHKLKTKGPTFLTEEPGNTEQFSERVCPHLELSDIQSCRLRSLFDWHYAEHHDPSIFPQVLQVASEEYCCLDTFRGSHNNIRYIFCHNPKSLHYQCKESWDVVLHTDVKFRKYLEHVTDIISDWTREEELKREAIQHSSVESQEDEKVKDSAEEEEDTLEPVIRKESLKALKLEQERLKEEEMDKKSKRENTPKGKKPKEEAKTTDNKNDKNVSVTTPIESSTVPPGEENKELHQTEERFHGFTGYSMDGMLIHVSGRLQHLFPSDGGHITVENITYVEGSCLMKLAVKKDGHHFYTHINQVVIHPARPPSQPPKKETSDKKDDCKEPVVEKRVKQGSLTAVLNNGVHLSYSFYGPTGECRVNTQETDGGITDATTQVPAPLSSSSQDSKNTDLDSDPVNTQIPSSQDSPQESQVSQNLCEGQPARPSIPFNSVNLSVPNGLLLQFLREDIPGESSEVQVRQSFPLRGRGGVGQLLDPSLSKELSRIVNSQGAVIRYMRDGSTEVLFADGSVSFSQDGGPVWVADSEVKEENTPNEAKVNMKEQSKEKAADAQRGCWLTTTPSGARICTVGTTHKHLPTTPVLAFKATDSITHEVMLSREDLVVSVQNSDGSSVVDHADGTRITSLHQERPSNTEEQHKSVTLNEKSRDNAGKACGKENDSTELMACEDVCDERECDENALCKNGAESVFAKENGETRPCETDEGSVSTKERVMLVEKEGCATVVMYPERHTAHVFLADGTVITGNNQGAYQVFPSNGLLQIQSDGKCVYSSDPLVTPSPMGDTPTNQPGSYTMSHTDKVACDITDADGNHFQVMEDGQVSVLNVNPTPSTLKHDEEKEEEDREVSRLHEKHCPRLFLVHEDGSGTELLRSQTVEELLYQAYSDPTVAVRKEPLPDTQDEFGITILKPSHQSVCSKWMLGKQNPDITPPNLRNRNWRDFPRKEKKSRGPAFGTNMGRGLTLREWPGGSAAQHQHVRGSPKVLEMRELCQHQPFTRLFKNTIDARLKEYIESLMERDQRSEAMKVKNPRTDKESVHASDLLNLVLSFREKEDTNPTFVKRTSVDIGNLYSQGIGAQDQQPDISKSTGSADSDSSVNVKESKWTEKHAQYRQEVCEEKACRAALRRKSIVPYFHPENIPLYQLQNQAPDMKRLSMDLPPIPKSDCAEAFLKDAPQENTPRPLNPTPSQSASRAAGSDGLPVRRPTNPTPQTAGESSQRGSPGPYKSVQVDVTGEPRRTKVRLPTSILVSKPRSMPNQQFLSLDEPLRRRCRTISLTNPNVVVRGFLLLPSTVDFGTVQEGTSSSITVVMKNVGVDTCRFHVKQPRPSTGLRVIYNPGPVAAGLQVELQVQLFAKCTSQPGDVETKKHISQDIIIHTETDIFFLPVTAIILPERLYDILLKERTSAHKKKSSRVLELSSSLPDGQGVAHRRPDTLLTSSAAKPGNLNRSTSQ